MGWDEIRRFLAKANTWTGKQTFSDIAVTGGTISGVTFAENFTTSADPAENAAVTTAIVDSYDGVVVTLSAAGNTQTIQNPTTAATIRKFMVINNDTSTHSIPFVANSVTFTLTPGEGQCFLWDGSAWGPTDLGITDIPVKVTQGGTGLATITDHGIILGSGTGAVTPLGVATDGQIPIGSSGADPVLAAITPGDGIDVTNAAGSITIAVDLKANGGLVIDTTELTVDLSASAITGTLAVGDGGTGASTLTDHGILLGSGTDAVTPLGAATNGQLPIGSTGADPVLATITEGEAIDITNAAGAITIACEDATTANKGVTVYSGSTKAIAGTDTASAMTPADVAAAMADYVGRVKENLIGTPGAMGFGVGICPPANLPDGMVGMPGYDQLGSDNYGNYIYKEGSVMIWVPRFYYRIAHASNPTYATYGVNSIDIKGIDTYPTTALANAAGYALHRAFVDGGVEKLGFFRDKYKCSKVANGTGFTAASIKNGLPLSSYADHNPFSGLTGGANFYYSAIDLAHRRDGVDGAVNASSIFFCSSQFLRSAIVMLSLAHGQAATSTANCAWYHATYNYPKGCNNNALKDVDDTTVAWESDGYDNCGKTGSAGYGGGAGNVFAKSTHNGQNCGSADDNGLIYEISIGTTCIASTKAIEAISRANPCEITITGHGLVNGDIMQIRTAITQADWVGLNSKVWPITKTGDNTFTVAFNSSAFGTAYDAGADPGTCVLGTFYAAKEATSMKDFTNGVAAATDHWGATGVAAMMDRFAPPFGAGDAFAQKFGSGVNQVLSEATSGDGYLLSGLGLPKDADGMDATGTNLFGKDYCYVYVSNDMCLVVASGWGGTAVAGVWYAGFSAIRGHSGSYVGFRAAAYHV